MRQRLVKSTSRAYWINAPRDAMSEWPFTTSDFRTAARLDALCYNRNQFAGKSRKEANTKMAYEIYVKEYTSKSSAPTLTISQKLGRCTLNRAAAALFQKEAVENVLLMWDKEASKFGIRPIVKKDARSFTIRYAEKDKTVIGAAFSGVMFLRHIGYDLSTTGTYPIKWSSEESIFEVELPKERFVAQQPLMAVEGGKKHAKVG
jgi:hypothetical protein